jgi:hypothetical protein
LNITRVFLTDFAADVLNLTDFENLRKEMPTFLIDHHPINSELKDFKNIIKADTPDCSSLILWNLGEGFINKKKWKFLIASAIISDFSYLKEDNFLYLKMLYPEISKEKILESDIGKLSLIIGGALIYYQPDIQKVYNFLNSSFFEKLMFFKIIVMLIYIFQINILRLIHAKSRLLV